MGGFLGRCGSLQRLQDQAVPMLATRWVSETRALCVEAGGGGRSSSFRVDWASGRKDTRGPARVSTASPQTVLHHKH